MSEGGDARLRFALGALEGIKHCADDLAGHVSAPTSFHEGAPVDTGELRASTTVAFIVNGASFDGEGGYQRARQAVRAAVAASAPVRLDAEVRVNKVYAARQHEELDWKHPKGGRSKYLQAPLMANAARYERIIGLAAATAV
jgi:hypothetical protein